MLRAAKAVGGGILGVDAMESKDEGYTIHEVNNTVEFKGAQAATEHRIAKKMIDYVIAEGEEIVVRVGVLGASGYAGGELLRLLIGHGKAEVAFARSRRYADEYLFRVHPNLRGVTDMQFVGNDLSKIAARRRPDLHGPAAR